MSFGDVIQVVAGSEGAADNSNILFSQTATLGNLILIAVCNDVDGTDISTIDFDYDFLVGNNAGDTAYELWYRLSDGTEDEVTPRWNDVGELHTLVMELEWDGSVPLINTNDNVTNISSSTNSQPSGALIPARSHNLVVAVHGTAVNRDSDGGEAIDGSWAVINGFNPGAGPTTVASKFSLLIDVTGSQEATHTDTDVGASMYGAIIDFSVPSGYDPAMRTETEKGTNVGDYDGALRTEAEKEAAGGDIIATGLITENESLFAATVTPGAVSVSTGLITENESLFAATATPGAVSATTGLLTENESLFALTPIAGAVSIAVGLITENESLFAAAVISTGGPQSIPTGLITENEALFAAPPLASILIATGLITENEALFAATPAPGAVSATTGLITENEALFPATPAAGVTAIPVGLITENETLLPATPAPGTVSATTGLITENETLSPATPASGVTAVPVGLITENEELFAVTPLAGATSISTGLITENEVLFVAAPLIGEIVGVGLITENEILFSAAPAAGGVSVAPGLLTENESLFPADPQIGTIIGTGLITENESLFAVSALTGVVSISVGQITENESLFAVPPLPSISIATGLITEQESLFGAVVAPGIVSISTGLLTENETLSAVLLGVGVLGGVFNAASWFPTGGTVTITLVDPVTGSAIALDDNSCNENGSTGLYFWDSSKLTVQPLGYQEYGWTMTDGATIKGGMIRMFDATDSDRLQRIWQSLGLDPSNPATIDEDGSLAVDTVVVDADTTGVTPNRQTVLTRTS